MKVVINFFLLFNTFLLFSQQDARFRIIENNKIGYINSKGEIVIKPIYNNGSDFSDGLAAVRENGLYGFIDINGIYIIQPQYEYASAFHEGFGAVYKDGKKQIINRKGENAIPSAFIGITLISKNKAIVSTITQKKGIIDLNNKKLLADTIYDNIEPFYKGISVVQSFNERNQTYVIDTLGNVIVQPGLYNEINAFSDDDIAIVKLAGSKNDDRPIQGAIDLKGKLLFTYENKYSSISGDFHNGLAIVSDNAWEIKPENAIYHRGYINTSGKIVYNDHTIERMNDFSNKRAFVYNGDKNILIDNNFNKVGDSLYSRIFSNNDKDIFIGNYAIVQSSNYNWGVIDTTGQYQMKPKLDEIYHFDNLNGLVFFTVYDKSGQNARYGICDVKGQIVFNPLIDDFDSKGFINGLLRLNIDDKLTYINKQGTIVWQQKKSVKEDIKYLNIDFMNRGYCYAYSETEKNNGWAMSENFPKKIKTIKFPKTQLSLVIDKNEKAIFNDQFYGCKLYLANTTDKKIKLNASDSRLNILLQAINNKGNWEYIEYAPSSWCGNSYHNLYLNSGEYWNFTMPLYQGSFKTKVRAVLQYYVGKQEQFIYSNSIELSVNPAQFFNQLKYYRNNLMDPYND